MSDQKIKELLDKYFAAETSLSEEETLRQFFSAEEVPEQWQAYRPLFQYFSASAKQNPPEHFEQELLKKIRKEQKPRLRILRFLPYAAAVALLIGLIYKLPTFAERQKTQTVQNVKWEQFEPQSEEEALQETMAALRLLAEKLNGGKKETVKEIQNIEKLAKPTAVD